jgi:hypothetical protein
MKPRIIGLAGNKGVGKSTVAGILSKHGYKEISYAEPMKLAIATAVGCSYEDLENPEIKDAPLPIPLTLTHSHLIEAMLYLDENFKKIPVEVIRAASETACSKTFNTYREVMQYFGTEVIRDFVGDTYWVDIMRDRVNKVDTDMFVITDARFPNERALVKELWGTTALILREGNEGDGHRSEKLMGTEDDYDLIFHNTGTVAQLALEIDLWFSLKGV